MTMEITVTKLTDLNQLHTCAEYTTGHESKMSLAQAYASGHSIIRSQIFFVECKSIPLFVASQLVRSHVGVQFFQRSKRTDRGGEDFTSVCNELAERVEAIGITDTCGLRQGELQQEIADDILRLPEHFDRMAPTDLCFIANAEALINMAHKRLCRKASPETRAVMLKITEQIGLSDPSLTYHLVPMCVYRNGICSEPKSCGFNFSPDGRKAIYIYKTNQAIESSRKE